MRSRMAKGKHSAALFEVIARQQPSERQLRPGLLRSAAGWLRPRDRAGTGLPIYHSLPAASPQGTTSATDDSVVRFGISQGPMPPQSGVHFDAERSEIVL